jgi:hypothetical protein
MVRSSLLDGSQGNIFPGLPAEMQTMTGSQMTMLEFNAKRKRPETRCKGGRSSVLRGEELLSNGNPGNH